MTWKTLTMQDFYYNDIDSDSNIEEVDDIVYL